VTTVVVSVDQSEVVGGQPVTVTAKFTNDGGDDVSVVAVNRVGPAAGAGASDGAAVACAGFVVPADSTASCQWRWFYGNNQGLTIFTLEYSFHMSDGSLVTPADDPQIAVQNILDYSPGELAGIPAPGSLDFLSNTQSGLLAVI
jgi:hypothetical protein